MRRMIVPVLAAGLLALAGCSAAEDTGSAPDATTDVERSRTARTPEAGAPAADVVDAELRTVTIDVMGMG